MSRETDGHKHIADKRRLEGEIDELLERNAKLEAAINAFVGTIDADDLEELGWSCEVCPRKDKVKSRKHECNFSDCLENFIEKDVE